MPVLARACSSTNSSAVRGHPATATSHARTMRSRPRWRRAVPTGAWRSSRSHSFTGLGSCLWRRRNMTSCWSRRAASGRPCRRSWRRCATRQPVCVSARLVCAQRMTGHLEFRCRRRLESASMTLRRCGGFLIAVLALALAATAQAQLRGHGGPVRALAISPDGKLAVSGSFDTSAIRWSLEREAAIEVLRFHEGAVNAVAYLPDGRVATAGEDGRIALWRSGEPQPAAVLEGHAAPVVALAVSPDGKMLASASWDHSARLWPLT